MYPIKSMEYKPAPLLHHPKMMAQMHLMHQNQEMKFHPHIAQFNNPQFLFKSPPDHPSAFHSLAPSNHQEPHGKSVSWQEDGNFYADLGRNFSISKMFRFISTPRVKSVSNMIQRTVFLCYYRNYFFSKI